MRKIKKGFDRFIFKYGVVAAIFVGCLMIAISIYLSFGVPNQKLAQKALSQSFTSPTQVPPEGTVGGAKVEVGSDDDEFLGDATAPVVMIEFSDFQCPFCRKFWRDTLPQIKEKYIDTGKVKFVYRDFPLDFHAGAKSAAEAAECAREQGKFWQMHDQIFQEQDKKGEGTIQFDLNDLKKWAQNIDLNLRQFNDCFDSGKYREEVEKDLTDGQTAGVEGTPGFFVNGRVVRGAVPYSFFENVINEELAKTK